MTLRLTAPAALLDGFDRIRADFEVPTAFPSEVLDEARSAVPDLEVHTDLTDVEFVAIDPPGATDLDQALHISRRGDGYTVRYAIADLGAFVDPEGTIDVEARRRGVTLYLPDARSPLHPRFLSEYRSSLLPGVERPALVWAFDLSADATVDAVRLQRAIVTVRESITYVEAQRRLDEDGDDQMRLLSEVGEARREQERLRGGVSLELPSQIVERLDGGFRLGFEETLDVERWNAQISLMTGMEAGRMLAAAGVGVLRTLPDPDPADIATLRRHASALGIEWPESVGYADFIRGITPRSGAELGILNLATRTLRGAGYVALDGPAGDGHRHGAINAQYAHVTAPLRRMVDRYDNEILLALFEDRPLPGWAVERTAEVAEAMQSARSRAGAIERAVLDFTEAVTLTGHEGERFEAIVIRATGGRARVQTVEPAVVADVRASGLDAGDRIRLELVETDPTERRVTFAVR